MSDPQGAARPDLPLLSRFYAQGDFAGLEAETRRQLERFPGEGFLWKVLGVALDTQGKDAVAVLTRAAELLPGDPECRSNLGNAFKATGQLAAAEACYREALRMQPAFVTAHYNLGVLLQAQERWPEAAACYTQALALVPEFAVAHYNLGLVRESLDDPAGAEAAYLAAIRCDSRYVDAHYNLGLLCQNRGDLDRAEAIYRGALPLSPAHAEMHCNLGEVSRRLGRPEFAAACFAEALRLKPDLAEAHCGLANLRTGEWRFAEAEPAFREALRLQPDYPEALVGLAVVLQGQGCYAEAEAACRQALLLRPGMAEARNNLGLIQTVAGRYEEAAASFREALAAKPDYLETFSNLLFAYNYSTTNNPDFCLAEAQRYGALAAQLAGARYTDWRCSDAPSPLRVGVVSGDLRDHSVGYFLEAMLGALAEEGIELIAYPTQPAETVLTARIKPVFAAWTPLYGLDDAAAAARIRDDGVQVLLDLSGHTAHNRLAVFARKPAPVQASWLGYCATTGLAEMDWYLADAWTLPEAQERYFTERIRRLPGNYLCFSPPADDVATNELPALANGYVTFGSFNNLSKMTDEVVATWSRVLAAVPGSRLLLKSRQLADAAVAEQVRARYAAHGIAGERLQLAGPVVERGGHLAAYRQVDIGLDPFPYNGVTTTMEALWMGVPVLSVAGERFLARQGLGLLSQAGLADWVAQDGEALVALAAAKAGELTALAGLRATLRERLQAGPLLDRRGFAAHFADALRAMWRERK